MSEKNRTVRTRVAGRSVDLILRENQSAPSISVRVSVERKIRLLHPGRRHLSHAARAFLEVVRRSGAIEEPTSS